MIITENVFIQVDSRTKHHYLALGYVATPVSWSRYYQFYVEVKDLLPASRARVIAKCVECNNEREVSFHQYRSICHACSNLKPASDETKKKLSKAHKGLLVGEKNPAWKGGKPVCKECGNSVSGWHQKLCGSCFLKRDQRGDNNPMWKNYTEEERRENLDQRKGYLSRRWTTTVKRKYENKCDVCGDTTSTTHAHHLDNWKDNPDKRFDEYNGVCLCESCHYKFHSKYGKSLNTKEQYYKFKEDYNG